MTPSQNCTGRFLVAAPYLTDGNFFRSVVFLIKHSKDGAFGVIINQPGTSRFSELIEMSSPSLPVREGSDHVFLGGPVRGPLLALHDVPGLGDPCGDIASEFDVSTHGGGHSGSVPAWVTAEEDHLRLLLHRTDARVKYVVGYSGWGAGQLDGELRAGGWLVTPADASSLFVPCDDLWEKLVKRCGQAVMEQLAPDTKRRGGDGFDPGLN